MFERLFSPIRIRDMELENRVVMTGMGTRMVGGDGREVTDRLIRYHVERARGGVGLNTVEVCSVDAASAPKGFLALSDDKYIPGMKKLADAVHEAGGKICPQLWQGSLAVGSDPDAEILVASKMRLSRKVSIKGMSKERIHSIVKAYGEAARRAAQAGMDAVEFHTAHTYLPHVFLSGGINHRTDEYGGSFENRCRFPLECIRAIRQNIPEGMPLFMRIVCHDDYLENGLTEGEVIEFCKLAGREGVDVLNISRGNFLTRAQIYEIPPIDLPKGINVGPASRIRKETGMLTMPSGRINTPGFAEEILEEDKADLIAMSRAQLADPYFCKKAKEGKLAQINYCVGCDQGCYDYFINPEKDHISCMRNPAVGEEEELKVQAAEKPRRVMIAGGGIAGLEIADILQQRGHKPAIYEKTGTLGGQFVLAGTAPRKDDFGMAGRMAAQKAMESGIDIFLNTEVTAEVIEKEKPDVVVVAVGSVPFVPPIAGIDQANVMSSKEVLSGTKVPMSGNVVVIGGGLVGLEVSEHLERRGCHVTVVEMREGIGIDLGHMRKTAVQIQLEQGHIHQIVNAACKEIREKSVVLEVKGETMEVPADYVVIATGSRAKDSTGLQECCERLGIPVYVIGDAKRARKALDTIYEAYLAALEI